MMKRGHDVESAPSIWRRRTAMEHYAGIDVSLELSSVCVVDAQGKIVKEAKVASEPEAVVAFFEALGFAVKRIGLEAGPLSHWLHAGLCTQQDLTLAMRNSSEIFYARGRGLSFYTAKT